MMATLPDGAAPSKRRRGRPRQQDPADAPQVQSLDRAVRLLTLIAEGDGLSLSEAAERAGLPAPTAYRMLTTLERHGLVEFEAPAQLWHVGVDAFRIGAAFLRRRKLAERGRAVMQDLVERCGETANLAVADEGAVVFVAQIESHEAIRAFFRPGTRGPMHASGVGKAILAHLPRERVARLVARAGLERFTARTIIEPERLWHELAAIRGRGWSVDDEERHLGMRCVAAAIFDELGQPVAGVSISGPSVRVSREATETLGPIVRDAAAAITRSIAGAPPG
jgi:IclR family acetate operon transcriptional repressor